VAERLELLTAERRELAVPAGRRLYVAVVVGIFSAVWTTVLVRGKTYPGDFEQVWYAARAILAGKDPYQLIGPGRPFEYDFLFRYPLSAAVVAIPVTPIPADVASGLLLGSGLACLAWALMRYGHAPLIGLLSAGVWSAVDSVQWSPLLASATVMAPLGVLFVAKPTIGLAMFAARPSRWAVVGGLVVTAIAFLIQPTWLSEWRSTTADRVGITSLVLHPGGVLALLSLLKWRRPEARMLAILACVPMTPVLYETVPLLLVPRRRWEAVSLVIASYVALVWARRIVPPLDFDHRIYAAYMENSANGIALVLYPLATLMVLRRPNEGKVPALVERLVERWPARLRGRHELGA
jgi:hypothetical protein